LTTTTNRTLGSPAKTYTLLTLAIAVLVILVSSAGIFVTDTYAKETKSWALQAIGQDIANLISVPILVAGAFLAAKGSVRGLAIWIGVLLFLMYAFVIYAFDIHYNSLFLIYVAVLSLSFYAFFGKMVSINSEIENLQKHFSANSKAKHVSIFLMIVAVLFYFQWLSQDIPAILANDAPQDVKEIGIPINPVHVLDLGLFLPAMIITSILLRKRRTMGYLFAAPLLIFSALTGAGILFANALIRLNGTPVSYVPDLVVGTIVAVSIALGWLYLREVKNSSKL
jgi:flagellar biosynthesis protein FliQ